MFNATSAHDKDAENNTNIECKEFSIYISILANEDKLNKDIIYYYPNSRVSIDKSTINPETPSFYLNFYKHNLPAYEHLIKNVKLLIAVIPDFTDFNTSIGNIVKIKRSDKEKRCILSCMSLLSFPETKTDEDLSRIKVYAINAESNESNLSNLSVFFKKMEYIMSNPSIEEKIKIFGSLKREYNMIQLEKDNSALKSRSEFIKYTQFSDYDFLLKNPSSGKKVTPGLDILILNEVEETAQVIKMCEKTNPIEIDLEYYENINLNTNDTNNNINDQETDPDFINFTTYVTHHIPRQKLEDFEGKSKKLKDLMRHIEKENLTSYIKKNNKYIYYENIRDLEFSKTCCIYYDRSINFGHVSTNNQGLGSGHYTFNKNSVGTMLFDARMKPLGVSFLGTIDFYPQSNLKTISNLFIPFIHPGLIYILRKFVYPEEEINLSEFLNYCRGGLNNKENISEMGVNEEEEVVMDEKSLNGCNNQSQNQSQSMSHSENILNETINKEDGMISNINDENDELGNIEEEDYDSELESENYSEEEEVAELMQHEQQDKQINEITEEKEIKVFLVEKKNINSKLLINSLNKKLKINEQILSKKKKNVNKVENKKCFGKKNMFSSSRRAGVDADEYSIAKNIIDNKTYSKQLLTRKRKTSLEINPKPKKISTIDS